MTIRDAVTNILLCLAAVIVAFGLLEIGLRTYLSFTMNSPFWGPSAGVLQTDERLGWKPIEFYRQDRNTVDNSDVLYAIEYRTYQHGFREWQDNGGEAAKVFFIGDSYTAATAVSNNKTYYSVTKQSYPIDVFAFGGSGYGSLQQYLVLDSYLADIDPDLIVWQFTPNDFFDNSVELDRRYGGVVMGRRPFLIDNKIEYRTGHAWINQWLFEVADATSSRLLHLLHQRLLALIRFGVELYPEVIAGGFDDHDFKNSYDTTLEIAIMMVKRAAPTEIVAFCVRDRPDLFYQTFLRIMNEAGIEVIVEVPEALNAAERSGVEIRGKDGGHWNEKGHEIVGVTIAQKLRERFRAPEVNARDSK